METNSQSQSHQSKTGIVFGGTLAVIFLILTGILASQIMQLKQRLTYLESPAYHTFIRKMYEPTPTPMMSDDMTRSRPYSDGIITFINNTMHYSFQHYESETVISYGAGMNPPAPEESRDIMIVDAENPNSSLLTIQTQTPPVLLDFKNWQEAMQSIFEYHTSSRAQYPSPELNKLTGPTKTQIGSASRPILAYRYEVRWSISPAEGSFAEMEGTDVWVFIPLAGGGRSAGMQTLQPYVFLQLRYDKNDEARLSPILNSFLYRGNGFLSQ